MPRGRIPLDISDRKFGRLRALRDAGIKNSYGGRSWLCLCDCGKETTALARQLIGGAKKSCGCMKLEASVRNGNLQREHGQSAGNKSATYRSWSAMRSRCNNKLSPKFKDYGGRGIAVCDRWNSFPAFLADMGERPEGKTLDRYPNNDGNYEPGNCRWATPKEQARNRRDTVNAAGVSLAEFCEENGITRGRARYWLGVGRLAESLV